MQQYTTKDKKGNTIEIEIGTYTIKDDTGKEIEFGTYVPKERLKCS